MNKRIPEDKFIIGAYILQPYAQTEAHIKELSECGVRLVVCFAPKDRSVLDLLEKYHVGCIITGILPGWWGGDGTKAGTLHERNTLDIYEKKASEFADHPAVWGIDIGDEPSALDFDHYGKIARTVDRCFTNQLPYLNLYPNYASVAANNEDQTMCQLGTATYAEHIQRYIEEIDLPYISYDFYVYSLPESIGVGKMLDNFRIVADACRKTGRRFWYIPQVNGLHETDFTSEDMLRYQAYIAMCYGATVINWACYTGGWWCNNVLDKQGNKTEQYDKLKKINAELERIAPVFMEYANTDTHLMGFENDPWYGKYEEVCCINELNTGAVRGLRADKGKLVIGQMVHRKDPGKTALLVCNASDPYGREPSSSVVSFRAFRREVKAYSGEKVIDLHRNGDEYSFNISSDRAVLITLE